jgi:hypothetical protein
MWNLILMRNPRGPFQIFLIIPPNYTGVFQPLGVDNKYYVDAREMSVGV